MFCKSCGKEVENDTKFCKYCGSEVSQSSPEKTANLSSTDTGEKKIEINLSGVQQIFSGVINARTILGCIIALFLFFGVFFPWVTAHVSMFGTATSYSASGTKVGSYGTWVIITGILCAILSFLVSKKNRVIGFLILGFVSAIDILVFIINFHNEVGSLGVYASLIGGLKISKGIGMWISLVGAIGAIIFGILELRKASKEDYPSIK